MWGLRRGYDTREFQLLGTHLPHLPENTWGVIGPDGHYRGGQIHGIGSLTDDGTSPAELAAIEKHIVYLALHEDGTRHTYTPEEFQKKFHWQNDPHRATVLQLPGEN
jgi:hypothetical protein